MGKTTLKKKSPLLGMVNVYVFLILIIAEVINLSELNSTIKNAGSDKYGIFN
jgi:hypothetical protein